MQADHIIVGQGICGTLLSHELQGTGRKVVVIDDGNVSASSKVASGIINPVTGKRLVRTWLADQLLPYAQGVYTDIGNELDAALVRECSIMDFHLTHELRDTFNEKIHTEGAYLSAVTDPAQWEAYFRFHYGIGKIAPCLLIDIGMLLAQWRKKLAADNSLIEERFDIQALQVGDEGVVYKDISAGNIIFCDGAACADNPYFGLLPWSKDKGEALLVSIPDLPPTQIYKQGINIVPWHDGLFWVGATHDWKFTDMQPTADYRIKVGEQLDYWLRMPYEIADHIVAQRPANLDRKPFVGLHPMHRSVGIFNGMGSKGCSMAPYFAKQFAALLVNQIPVMPDVDVRRYSRILGVNAK